MVEATLDKTGGGIRFVLRPNRSLSWKGTIIFVLGLTVLYLLIGIPLAILGFWPILPFAGLELIVIAICLYWVSLKNHRKEIIWIDDRSVRLERGRSQPDECVEFIKAWTRVDLQKSGHAWYPSRLLLGAQGRFVEIGAFLHEDERRSLARELTEQLSGTDAQEQNNKFF